MQELLLSRRFRSASSASVIPLGPKAGPAKSDVERKLREGRYALEEAPCLCGASDDVRLAQRDRYGFPYSLVGCRACGLLRASPRMTAASYAEFYDREYRVVYGDADMDREELYRIRLDEGRAVFDRIRRDIGFERGVVLDIGCNMGTTLLPFAEAGCEVYGVDFGSEYLDYGKSKTGLKTLLHGGVEKFAATGRKADLVILHHVFEHLCDVEAELAKVLSVISPSGRLYIALPGTFWAPRHDYGGNVLSLLQNAHVYQFSLASLRYVVECGGFEMLKGTEEIVAYFRPGARRAKSDAPRGEFERVLKHLRRTEAIYGPKNLLRRAALALGLKAVVRAFRRAAGKEGA